MKLETKLELLNIWTMLFILVVLSICNQLIFDNMYSGGEITIIGILAYIYLKLKE